MISKSYAKYQRVPVRKTRLVANEIRGKGADEALSLLKFTPSKPAKIMYKVIKSAIANAENNNSFHDSSRLFVSTIEVNAGPVYKRYTPRAYGRASLIRKPTSHIRIELSDMTEVK